MASAAQAAAGDVDLTRPRVTAKSLDAFGHCFIAAQDRQARPWWFVPKEDGGGTFSNARSPDDEAAYFVRLQRTGSGGLQIRAEERSQTQLRPVVDAIDGCI
jgi:hypothetical protein